MKITPYSKIYLFNSKIIFRLVETGFGDKKGFTDYLKTYMKKVLKYLEENDRKAEIEEFKTNINKVMKEMMGKFKDLQFFTGKKNS